MAIIMPLMIDHILPQKIEDAKETSHPRFLFKFASIQTRFQFSETGFGDSAAIKFTASGYFSLGCSISTKETEGA
ncbi:MAG TPA: hypothetical protein VF644_07165 [Pyrinomonadaceae bacterium]|jgi:hypothetical protein